jgi:opacity protein-like surface antigen
VDGLFNHVELDAHHAGFVGFTGTCDISTSFSTVAPGLQLGYSHAYSSHLVWGIEGDFNYNLNQQGDLTCPCPINSEVHDSFTFFNREEGSLRGHIGYAIDKYSLLPFLTLGGSLANMKLEYSNEIGDNYSTTDTKVGWLVGAGIEWKVARKWSIRTEYYYTVYQDLNLDINTIYGLTDPNGGGHASLSSNNVRFVVNYWF